MSDRELAGASGEAGEFVAPIRTTEGSRDGAGRLISYLDWRPGHRRASRIRHDPAEGTEIALGG
jgi:hypothetical protein